MALLDDLKTSIGTTSLADAYLETYYLNPAINKASEVSNNLKQITVTLQEGTTEYDLTNSSVASPTETVGVQEISFDDDFPHEYIYKQDFFFSDVTKLNFLNANIPITGDMTFNYYGYYNKTTLPTKLYPSVIMYAKAKYMLDGILNGSGGLGSGSTGTAVEISEANLKQKFGSSVEDNRKAAINMIEMAVEEMKIKGGWNKRQLAYSLQVI